MLVHPLNALLNIPSIGSGQKSAFQQAKQALSSASVLVHYDPTLSLTLAGDASAVALEQLFLTFSQMKVKGPLLLLRTPSLPVNATTHSWRKRHYPLFLG